MLFRVVGGNAADIAEVQHRPIRVWIRHASGHTP